MRIGSRADHIYLKNAGAADTVGDQLPLPEINSCGFYVFLKTLPDEFRGKLFSIMIPKEFPGPPYPE